VQADGRGRFRASALLRGAGLAVFRLQERVSAGNGTARPIDTISVPVSVHPGAPLKLIVRAGAINPELKYWRRWAADAGFDVALRAALSLAQARDPGSRAGGGSHGGPDSGLPDGPSGGPGDDSPADLALRDADASLTPQTLATADLVLVDARGWQSLAADEKQALRSAVNAGLGLLLRADGPVDPAVAADWAQWGFTLRGEDRPRRVTLDRATGLAARDEFTLAPVQADAVDAQPLLAADDGGAVAWWRPQREGRVGLWLPVDTFRLQLAGESGRYASLWADALARLARPRGRAPQPRLASAEAWIDERVVICGLPAAAASSAPAAIELSAPDGGRTPLRAVDGCAAAWPSAPGWWHVGSGANRWPFYVHAAADGASLHAAQTRAATAALASSPPGAEPARTLPRWLFALAWLSVAGLLWWRERTAVRMA
jgi:hypothetical protein